MNVKPDRLSPVPADERVAVGTQKLALDYMLKALELLDNDAAISPLIGAQLQLAIDRLKSSLAGGSRVA
jgi:hypothetical protein